MIRIQDLSFAYAGTDTWELKDINLEIGPGETVLVCGPSGSGKTTLTKAVNGLIPHFEKGRRAGRVLLEGRDVKDIPPHDLAGKLGTVFQDPRSQFFTTRVKDEILWGCENLGVGRKEMARRLEKSLKDFGLAEIREKDIFSLSNGEQQQVIFGAVTAMGPVIQGRDSPGPDLLVLDEPSSNLDPAAVRRLARQIARLKAQGKTLVIAEHRLFYLKGLIDRLVVMDRGRIRAEYNKDTISSLTPARLAALGLRQMDLGAAPLGGRYPKGNRACESGPVLSLDGIRLNPIIDNLDLAIRPGEIIGLCGPNGSGKTALARALTGLDKKAKGSVRFQGRNLLPRDRIRISHMVLQQSDHQLFRASVHEELSKMDPAIPLSGKRGWGAALGSIPADEAGEVLRNLGLGQFSRRHPQALSGGQKQRLAIGCGLVRDPALLVLDEPTSGLDAGNMDLLARLLKDRARMGRTVLVITHDYEFIARACTRVLVLAGGTLRLDRNLPFTDQSLTDYLMKGNI